MTTVPYDNVVALEIGGPGAQQAGGGFFGGGVGPQGAVEGIAIASALNLLTTRTKIDTVICLQTSSAELFLHCQHETPDALRIRLSQVFSTLREQTASVRSAGDPAGGHAVDRLAKLADLLDKGLISREEFDKLKPELL